MKFDYDKIATIKHHIFCIYKITNLINNKIYVGKSTVPLIVRIRRHCYEVRKGTNRYLYDAIRHYGWDSFRIEVIESLISKENLSDREKFWIKMLKTNDPNFGYNMTEGGDGGALPREILIRLANDRRGKPISEETKRKISIGNKGKKVIISEEAKKKISAALKGRMPSKPIHEIMKGKPGAMLGKKHSLEARKLMSQNQRGKSRWSLEQREQMRIDRAGDKNPFWNDIPLDKLKIAIKENLSVAELKDKFKASFPTILSRIKILGFAGLADARKKLKEAL